MVLFKNNSRIWQLNPNTEYRNSKSASGGNDQNSNDLNPNAIYMIPDIKLFWSFNIRIRNLFRISNFVFRICKLARFDIALNRRLSGFQSHGGCSGFLNAARAIKHE